MFGAIVIISLVIALIFLPKEKDDITIPDDEPVEDNQDQNNNNQESETYATAFSVNLPSSISLLKGTYAILSSGYLQVTPNEIQSKINIEIVPRYNSSAFGLEYSNSTLTAKEVGSYNLIFSVAKSKTTNFSKTILVTVFDDITDAHIKQINDNIIHGESVNINNFFEFNTALNYSVDVDNKLSFLNGMVNALQVGESNLNISFPDGNITYFYSFKIYVNAKPQYYFVLPKLIDNTLEVEIDKNNYINIEYAIKDRDEQKISQKIKVEIEDENVATLDYVAAPLIFLNLLNRGTTKITLIYATDNSIKIEITLIVK